MPINGFLCFQHPVTPRCRVRKQVGHTNRWRMPESLGSDLLGSSQAIKAVSMPYNQTLVNIITGEKLLPERNNINIQVYFSHWFVSQYVLYYTGAEIGHILLLRTSNTKTMSLHTYTHKVLVIQFKAVLSNIECFCLKMTCDNKPPLCNDQSQN